ncbi:MAG TPA: nicotinate-nucleotide adenylyltransferase [Vicinamibacterales bacterium]|nr:nicotinate-nucleotide adenylyltransferase [Vicinamibacterales bacterium]
MSVRRIGILGGTFDPFHCGHLETALAAETALALSEVHVVPANLPWHRRPPQASSFHRFAMVSLAIAGRENWRADDLELLDNAESYTFDTLQKFHRRGYAPTELFFVLGADAFVAIETWRNYPRLLDCAHFAVVSRPGFPVADLRRRLPRLAERMTDASPGARSELTPRIVLIDAVTPDISATNVRERCSRDESIAGLVPHSVRQHIEQHRLYASSAKSRRAGDAETPAAAGRSHGQN